MIVGVIVGREIDRKITPYGRPVPRLIGEKPFIFKGWIPGNLNYARNSSWPSKGGSTDANSRVGASGDTRRSRYSRPKHVALIRRPRRTDGRQEIETRV